MMRAHLGDELVTVFRFQRLTEDQEIDIARPQDFSCILRAVREVEFIAANLQHLCSNAQQLKVAPIEQYR